MTILPWGGANLYFTPDFYSHLSLISQVLIYFSTLCKTKKILMVLMKYDSG